MNEFFKKRIENPWAGTSSYQDPETSDVQLKFCGRGNESFDVANLIENNIFVTLYGKSGTGKTSLLNAGVFPRLRKSAYFPINIRLGMEAIGATFQHTITTKIENAINNKGKCQTIKAVPISDNENATNYLWSYFACHRFYDKEGNVIFPVIVLDQFEEVLRNRAKDVGILLRQIYFMMDQSHALSDRMIDGLPYCYDFNFRFVVSIREDDLYRLEDSIDNNYLLNMKQCRFRLRNMSVDGARDVILVPGDGLFLENERDMIADTIINQIVTNKEEGVSTNILSLVCSRLFIEHLHTGKPNITMSLVEKFVKGNPFEKFYSEATAGLSRREKSYIEDNLVDSEGRRNSIPESDFFLHVRNGSVLFEGDKRILQRTSTSSSSGSCRIELIHDSFCAHLAMLKKKREKAKKLRFLATVLAIALVYVIAGAYLIRQKSKIRTQEIQINAQVEKLNSQELLLKNHKLQLEKKDERLQNYSEKLANDSISLSVSKDSLNKVKATLELKEKELHASNDSLNKVKTTLELKEKELYASNDSLNKVNAKNAELNAKLYGLKGAQYNSIENDTFSVVFDSIAYEYESPSASQIDEWKTKCHNICKNKIRGELKEYDVPNEMIDKDPYLILNSKSLADHKEKQSWFDLYSLMNSNQLYELYNILYREKRKLIKIEKKQEEEKRKYSDLFNDKNAPQLNMFAYEQARLENWAIAFEAIDKAIELAPKEAAYYDSKGELLLMRNKSGDEKAAIQMWEKIMIIDPDFLSKYNGTTPFYEELKKRRLIND